MNASRSLSAFNPGAINYGLSQLRGDVLGGASAAAVTLPVAMGYGVMSGLGAAAGLYGAVAVGILASLFGGTRGMVYGPNILITITMALVVAEYANSIAEAATTAILAGLIQILFGILGFGRYASYIPFSLTSGFFTAFGLLIIVKQALPVLGGSPAPGGVIETFRALPEGISNVNYSALILAAICLALHLAWRGRLLRISPAPFVVLSAGIVAGILWFDAAPRIGEIPTGLPEINLSAISLNFFVHVVKPAFVMALLGSIATFIVAIRVDAITGSQHKPNREMVGQGLGNILAGFTGGLAGSVGQGTFLNALSGGRTPVAGLTVAGLMVAVIFLLGPVAERIPFAVLAAILIMNGWNIVDRRFIANLHRIPRGYAAVMILTALLVLFIDLTTAIVIGLVIAALLAARRTEGLETSALVSVPLLDRAIIPQEEWMDEDDPFSARTGLVVFPDRTTVASARELSRILRPDIRGHQFVIFDLSKTEYVDDSAAMIIGELISLAIARSDRTIIIASMTPDVSITLRAMGSLARVAEANIAADVEEAKEIVRPLLREQR